MSFLKRGYVGGKFAIEVDNVKAGWIYGFDGGMASGDVITEKLGPDHLVHKHLSTIKYDDITVSCGPAMSRGFYDWINDSFNRNYSRKDGALIHADFNLQETSRLDFHQALVTEVGFPACDGQSKDIAKLQVKISPEYTRPSKGSSSISGGYPIDAARGKLWLMRNFRVQIDGLSSDCSRVGKLEGISIKQKTSELPVGELRELYREPATIEYPNVVISMPESHSDGFYAWYKSFVLDGQCAVENEKSGSIEYLAEDMTTVVCHIDLHGLGLFKLSPEKAESGSERIHTVRAEMYCESMSFQLVGAYA